MTPKFHKICVHISTNSNNFDSQRLKYLTRKKFSFFPGRASNISKCPQDGWHIVMNQPCPFCWSSNLEILFNENIWNCYHLYSWIWKWNCCKTYNGHHQIYFIWGRWNRNEIHNYFWNNFFLWVLLVFSKCLFINAIILLDSQYSYKWYK